MMNNCIINIHSVLIFIYGDKCSIPTTLGNLKGKHLIINVSN